jgi:hypothetical protein
MKKQTLLPFLEPEIADKVQDAALAFRGYAPQLSDSLGALVFGQLYGWRAVMMLHSRAKIRSYEEALGITFREHMPERTEHSDRILGVRLADELGKFWAVVKGDVSVPGGKAFIEDERQAEIFRTG